MKRYSFNYELAAQASSILYHAQQCAAREQWLAVTKCIDSARVTLDRFLAQDNMVEDNDCCDFYIKATDLPDDDAIDFCRDYLSLFIEVHPKTVLADEALRVINFCQDLMDDPTYDSVEQLIRNESGSWSSIVINGKQVK